MCGLTNAPQHAARYEKLYIANKTIKNKVMKNKIEDEREQIAKNFKKEIEGIVEKYGFKNFSMCGDLDGYFLGLIGVNSDNLGELFQSAMLISRLYQSAREKINQILKL